MKIERFFAGCCLLLFISVLGLNAQSPKFDWNKTLRVDFTLVGNFQYQKAYISKIMTYQCSFGSEKQMISPFDFGEYRYFIIDSEKGDTLFMRGFSTLFEEWRIVDEAKRKQRAFEQSIEMPMPLIKVHLVVESRLRDGTFTILFEEDINANDLEVIRFRPYYYPSRVISGDDQPESKFDILFVADGYRDDQAEIFFNQVKKLSSELLNIEPYKTYKESITIRAIAAPSMQSGPDDPRSGKWRNTILSSTFNTFGVDRYLETEATWKVFDVAAQEPHDHIIVLVNSDKYGGGGIYNHFSVVTAHHHSSAKVLIHEMGHGIGGLGDEYYGAEVSYNDFINLDIEPWQPNLTTLVNFDSKWKHLVDEKTPIPTPVRPMYKNTTGVFEGGGYVSKKVYRPAINCRMRSNEAEGFCEVCKDVLRRTILFYTL